MPKKNGEPIMDINDNEGNSIKEAIKEKLKEKIEKELLKEMYDELKLEEEIREDSTSDFIKIEPIEHPKSIIEELEPIPMEPVKTSAKSDKTKTNIKISIKAILKIASHSLKYANPKIPSEDWVEVIGLLAGKYNKSKDVLHIEDAYPMGHGTAVYAEIKDYRNYVKAFKDIKRHHQFICGWYHSHPSYGCFMSKEDLGTQARYQKLWDKAIALVIDPYQINGKSLGFEIYRADFAKRKWFSVPFEIKGYLDVRMLPEILEFMNPIIEGKAAYLEYDED